MLDNNAYRWADGSFAQECRAYLLPTGNYVASNRDGFYWIKPDNQAQFKVYCDMTRNGGGWTLLASFVNTDGTNNWSRPTGHALWQNDTTLGSVEKYQSADYKSEAWSRLLATDIMISDLSDHWVSYSGALPKQTMLDLLQSFTTCQTSAYIPPGDGRIQSSSAPYHNAAMLAFFTGDPNLSNNCAFTKVHSDSTIMAIGGHGCGTIGAGQWGTNYHQGMDWHANLDPSTACVACDSCGHWYGNRAVTSNVHSNNAGVHDKSTAGFLWVRNASDLKLGASEQNPAPSCLWIRHLADAKTDGLYWIQPDPKIKPFQAYCDMTTDDGGYTWLRIDDTSLDNNSNQDAYASMCAKYGMEIIVPRTKPHALAIKSQNKDAQPGLINVFPKTNGATGLSNWQGMCRGRPCNFWISDSNNANCQGNEPNGDNSTSYRLYRYVGSENDCDYGRWNDANNRVDIHGWVICSTNDK
jgi:hypothetical protein